jgi:hypothetical protein
METSEQRAGIRIVHADVGLADDVGALLRWST